MKGIKLKSREKKIIYIVIALAVIFISERFFVSPLITKIKNLNQQIKLEESKLKVALGMEKSKDLISRECNQYESYLSISGSSPEQEIITTFLKEIEKTAAESRISIISLSPQSQPEELKEAKAYNADLRAEASPYRILEFLQKVLNCGLLVELRRVNLMPKDEEANLLRLDATIRIIVPTK
jgi:hypothetical protein